MPPLRAILRRPRKDSRALVAVAAVAFLALAAIVDLPGRVSELSAVPTTPATSPTAAPVTTQQIDLRDPQGRRYDTESDTNIGRGTHFRLPNDQPDGTFSLGGEWQLGPRAAVPGRGAVSRVSYRARTAYLRVAGSGSLTVTTSDGQTREIRVRGRGSLVEIATNVSLERQTMMVRYAGDLQVQTFSFR